MRSRNPNSRLQKSTHTPRLLSRSPWPWLCLVLVAGAFTFAALAEAPAEPPPAQRIAGRLPLEPPVELLEVENSEFPCDVERVLKAKCRRCHTRPSRHGAPFELLTWHDTRKVRHGQPIYERMRLAIDNNTMPLQVLANPPVRPLTADERSIMSEWFEAGAPRGECARN